VTRTKEVMQEFVHRHVAGPRTVVATDQFRSYQGLGKTVRHETVDHSAGFVNPETGTHTNNAESAHAAVKNTVRVGPAKWAHWRRRRCATAASDCVLQDDWSLAEVARFAVLVAGLP
jgi:hypothetical protein